MNHGTDKYTRETLEDLTKAAEAGKGSRLADVFATASIKDIREALFSRTAGIGKLSADHEIERSETTGRWDPQVWVGETALGNGNFELNVLNHKAVDKRNNPTHLYTVRFHKEIDPRTGQEILTRLGADEYKDIRAQKTTASSRDLGSKKKHSKDIDEEPGIDSDMPIYASYDATDNTEDVFVREEETGVENNNSGEDLYYSTDDLYTG